MPTDSNSVTNGAARRGGRGMPQRRPCRDGGTFRGGVPQLHIKLGRDLFDAIVDGFGPAGWNEWIERMSDGHMVSAWMHDEPITPVVYWFDLENADLSGKGLIGINLTPCMLKGASFRHADLSQADLRNTDISGCCFIQAILHGVRLEWAVYDADLPPVGLPPELLRQCRAVPPETPSAGQEEVPIEAIASLVRVEV